MSKQKQGGKGKTPRHSPSDAMQKARTAANKERRIARAKAQVPKQRRIRTAEQYQAAYWEKKRAEVVRNTEVLYPNGNVKILQLIAAWKTKHNAK
jgi:hypothetical protein